MIRKIYLKLTEVAVGVFEKETNMQLLFLAYTKEKKKVINKYSFQASLLQLKLPTYIVVEADKLLVTWVRYKSLIFQDWCKKRMKVNKNKKPNTKIL